MNMKTTYLEWQNRKEKGVWAIDICGGYCAVTAQ